VHGQGKAFRSGELFEREFETSRGPVGILAEVGVEGKVLHLKDVSIYPRGVSKIEIGAREVMAMRDQLLDEVRGRGYEELRITGTRYSGASPGKIVDVRIRLSRQEGSS
jgi:hypothetical protein